MIIVLKKNATEKQIEHILTKTKKLGLRAHVSRGVERTIIGLIGPEDVLRVTPLEVFPGVEEVMPVLAPYRLVSREFKKESSKITIRKNLKIGDKRIIVMAGPCAVENEKSFLSVAKKVKEAGASVLRGGAFKPRTSPYDFQGLGEEGLKYLKEASEKYDIATVSEVVDPRHVELMSRYVDVLQVGARNMQNFTLLKEIGMTKKPVLLKRGISATIKEWLMSAEYILSEGNFNVILCERGIRTFETFTRNTLDINAVGAVKELSHLPVIVDPSHATGRWGLVGAAAKAGVAAGADGLIVEVHEQPESAMSDGVQSLIPKNFEILMKELKKIAVAISKDL